MRFSFIKSLVICCILYLVSGSLSVTAQETDCDLSCHQQPKYRAEDIHRAGECSSCHMKAEDIKKAHMTAQSQKTPTAHDREGVFSAQRPRFYLVPDQAAAINRFKGKEMVLPETNIEPPGGMVYIPAGEFIMGTNERWADEGPEHVLYLEAFFIDRYEVTNEQYKKFVDATGWRPPDHWLNGNYPEGLAKHPVTHVSWFDAMSYCQWCGKRLPIEQEWEKAARGTDGRTYPWGDEFDQDKSNNPQKESKGTEPVGSYESGKSSYGLYDMSGNIWEWVNYWYQPHPGNKIASEEYGEKYRVIKGGSWYNCLFYNCGISAPSFNRGFLVPITRNSSTGFRCAKDAK